MRLLASLFALLLIAPLSMADETSPSPFEQDYAAMTVVDAALAEALAEEKRLLLVFGANWCHDSRGLAAHFQDAELADTLADHYVTRFIDVGWRDQNQDVIRRFGVAALYATPMVMVIDPADETLLNRDEREAWGRAASTPVEAARAYFARWAGDVPRAGGVVESSLIYQAMMIEVELFEDEEGDRLAAAYLDIGRWRALPEAERPENFMALNDEVDEWRRELPRQVDQQRSAARSMVINALTEIAGDEPVSADTVAVLDRQNPDLNLVFQPHQSERW
ncbi:thioredoxin family protein [Maricaulis salignorans]|uniref:Thioredoxin-like n=1 Tax=Maricaulis salignorans TaxID=144026 RepID=A0A1G9S1Y3_9PROT|nr:thioredoxin family protein [Maricaulis salignorans]SDM29493.1 Thioredoxin-like [Maricaulis salignorans]